MLDGDRLHDHPAQRGADDVARSMPSVVEHATASAAMSDSRYGTGGISPCPAHAAITAGMSTVTPANLVDSPAVAIVEAHDEATGVDERVGTIRRTRRSTAPRVPSPRARPDPAGSPSVSLKISTSPLRAMGLRRSRRHLQLELVRHQLAKSYSLLWKKTVETCILIYFGILHCSFNYAFFKRGMQYVLISKTIVQVPCITV